MLDLLLFILVAFCIYIIIYLKSYWQQRKRWKLKQSKFPQPWISLLESDVYLYRKLPPNLKQELHKHIKIFLAEKTFVGHKDFVITDEVKLKIAAQACILLLGDRQNKRNYFPYLKYIYIYPEHLEGKKNQQATANLLLGQSSVGHKSGNDGIISLSWTQVERDSLSPNQGENVILHEFAHQLDQEFGTATGMPRLATLQDTLVWREIFAHEYDKHYRQVMNHQATVIDNYGATNPVEFFAVVTEAFFTKARLLFAYHPLLYEQLQKYYGVNPVNWN
jgi:Mlc titration factor MtfA (ptsG expression regulator)